MFLHTIVNVQTVLSRESRDKLGHFELSCLEIFHEVNQKKDWRINSFHETYLYSHTNWPYKTQGTVNPNLAWTAFTRWAIIKLLWVVPLFPRGRYSGFDLADFIHQMPFPDATPKASVSPSGLLAQCLMQKQKYFFSLNGDIQEVDD